MPTLPPTTCTCHHHRYRMPYDGSYRLSASACDLPSHFPCALPHLPHCPLPPPPPTTCILLWTGQAMPPTAACRHLVAPPPYAQPLTRVTLPLTRHACHTTCLPAHYLPHHHCHTPPLTTTSMPTPLWLTHRSYHCCCCCLPRYAAVTAACCIAAPSLASPCLLDGGRCLWRQF